jgi:hypothetical protein
MPWHVVKPVGGRGALEETCFESHSVVASAKIIHTTLKFVVISTFMNIFAEHSTAKATSEPSPNLNTSNGTAPSFSRLFIELLKKLILINYINANANN